MRRLVKDIKLTFIRHGGQELDANGTVTLSLPQNIYTEGSLQGYREGAEQSVLPAGIQVSDARLYYTSTLLKTADDEEQTSADITEIDGTTFKVFAVGDWKSTTILKRVAHYRIILIRVSEGRNS
tara:strand:- start:1357 stop:1731 length:375 start_codon:yes stop_codon:yes gene_type:complete